ncbi:anthocyanidin 3-O-glucosyltransferase 5-like [Gastrolobium bilobum]|uniref:anthocyanidin 3-O-glucosyltransferase 5-like n=1 Tax=Gastrolobium bilobum TaxID=150636 RepID=UPI002AAF9419|nr:anthocyanidin 3-O-glucosyltransferase 5-like [Gastrolobium bilobum]
MDMNLHKHRPEHIVLVSSPGLGHLIPVIELGKRFVLSNNFKVTILAVTSNTSEAETNILKSAMTSELIDVVEIPSANIDGDAGMVTRLCVMMREALPAIRSALSDMTVRPSVLVVDVFGTEALSIAQELNMPKYVFVASHAWFLSLVIYSPALDKQVEGQYVDQKEPLKIPGCNSVRPEDVVEPMLDRNVIEYQEYLGVANGIPRGDGILINTWEELQHKDLQALRDGDLLGRILKVPVYSVGPLVRQHVSETNPTSELVVQWLHKQPSESVIYVSFGSGGTLSYEQMTELACGLELSQQRFIWVMRPPTGGASDAAFFTTACSGGGDQLSNYLPEGFISRTHKVGLLVPHWAPQVDILRHPSVGGFLSHCGWSSTLESITNGVPMIVWPLYAEQRMNATLLAEELGVAVRPKVLPTKKVVNREEIASMVRQIMVVDESLKDNPIRERVKQVKHSAMKALSKGGSSYAALFQLAATT